MTDIQQKQNGGLGSNNVQIANVTFNNGLGYSDVKAICMDIFKDNFLKFKDDALAIAEKRINEFTDKYIQRLIDDNIENVDELKNPDMQYVLFEAQKAYARYGEKQLGEILIDLLTARTKITTISLLQINLNEAIKIAPQLLPKHFDMLSLSFLLSETINNNINSIDDLINYLKTYILPISIIEKPISCDFGHLSYLGCGTCLIGKQLGSLLANHYPKAFICIPPLNSTSHNDKEVNICLEGDKKINIKNYLISLLPEIENTFDIYSDTQLHTFDIHTVGIVIGYMNFYRKTGIKMDLSVWIK